MESIIKRPIVSEKATAQQSKGVYAFEVDKAANKYQIADVIEKMFTVKVAKVNTLIVRGKLKSRFVGGRQVSGKTNSYKKAIITLKAGETIDFFANI
jgi:large subunit ribosomal protein L23